jgi:hypothetical protein
MYIVKNIHYQFYCICLIYITATYWQHNAINKFHFFFFFFTGQHECYLFNEKTHDESKDK